MRKTYKEKIPLPPLILHTKSYFTFLAILFLMEKLIEQFNQNLASSDIQHVDNQTPVYGVLTCSDSRVNLAHLIGEDIYNKVFLIKNAGNKINDLNLWGIDYALHHTHVALFIVLWHSTCWACNYAFTTQTKQQEPFLDKELTQLKILAGICTSAEELEIKNIQEQVKKLRQVFPDDKDKIVGMYYRLAEKKVELVPNDW